MTLMQRVKQLCDNHGETLASLERKMDFGNGTIRRWDNATPSGDKLAKVADFFHVSVDYLLGREYGENLRLTKSERDLKVLARHLEQIPEEARNRLVKNFSDNIDTYLDAMGIPREDE